MKILNIEFNAFGSADIKEAFLAEGHTYVDFSLTRKRPGIIPRKKNGCP